ncbi:MAG TPA: hypothetical protein VE134_03875, partial [Methanomicrobiales archaeon]|nr:hypothetical protein [Methanomicrobiales archaeon]
SPFIRSLDELALDRLNESEREEVYQVFAPEAHMRLYDRGIRRRLAPMLEGDIHRLKMVFSLLFSLPGAPMFVYGDEIGMGDDLTLDERVSVRTPMQWSNTKNAGFSQADKPFRNVISTGPFRYQLVNVEDEEKAPDSLLNTVKKFIALRKANPAIGCSHCNVLDTGSAAVLGLSYTWEGTTLITTHNFSAGIANVTLPGYDPKKFQEIAGNDIDSQEYAGTDAGEDNGDRISLRPYGYRWFKSGAG